MGARKAVGHPIDRLTLSKFQCEGSLEELCGELQANPSADFDDFFRPILYQVLSKLIEWSENESPTQLSERASQTLAECLKFLSAQRQRWMVTNPAFAKRIKELARVRLPDTALTWLAVDYLEDAIRQRVNAPLYCTMVSYDKLTVAQVMGEEKWFRQLIDLPAFNESTWRRWAEAVYARLREHEALPRIRRVLDTVKSTRESRERRRSGKVKLSDKRKEIFMAVKALSSKPIGRTRGLTKPPESSDE